MDGQTHTPCCHPFESLPIRKDVLERPKASLRLNLATERYKMHGMHWTYASPRSNYCLFVHTRGWVLRTAGAFSNAALARWCRLPRRKITPHEVVWRPQLAVYHVCHLQMSHPWVCQVSDAPAMGLQRPQTVLFMASLISHAQCMRRVGVRFTFMPLYAALISQAMSFCSVLWGRVKGKPTAVDPSLPKPDAFRTTLSLCLSLDVEPRYSGRRGKMYTRSELKTMRYAAMWWWRNRVWLLWMKPFETVQSKSSLNCLHAVPHAVLHAVSRLCSKGWTALLVRQPTSMFGLRVQYDVTVRFCNIFGENNTSFDCWRSLASLECHELGKITEVWGSASEERGYVRKWGIIVSFGWLRHIYCHLYSR